MIGLDFHLNLNNEDIGMVIREFLDVSYIIFIIKMRCLLYVIVCTWIISYYIFPVEFMYFIRPHFYKGLKNPLTCFLCS